MAPNIVVRDAAFEARENDCRLGAAPPHDAPYLRVYVQLCTRGPHGSLTGGGENRLSMPQFETKRGADMAIMYVQIFTQKWPLLSEINIQNAVINYDRDTET